MRNRLLPPFMLNNIQDSEAPLSYAPSIVYGEIGFV